MSLWCKVFGHKWNGFEVTGWEVRPVSLPTGFGITITEGQVVEVGHKTSLKLCKRCGKQNPNNPSLGNP